MSAARAVRRLAAILSADAVGYSRLMRDDEAATRATLNAHLDSLFAPTIASRGGRIVKTMGDGLLAEFPSVVEAVECAVELQAGIAARNAGEPPGRRMDFRIGVNLGDIIVEGEDIHGDGVNVASRLESLAEPGGVCVSGSVFEHVRSKLPLRFEDMGPQDVKNIAEPISAYRLVPGFVAQALDAKVRGSGAPVRIGLAAVIAAFVLAGGLIFWRPWAPDIVPATPEAMAFPLPDKPSIAVLPLQNVSDNPEQAYFADGLTEDFITRLAGFPQLFVIARSSTEKFRGEAIDVREVAQDLGVRYVLEGSIRRAADDLRVTVRLIDALRGANLWAETYDRQLADVFEVQDEITKEVTTRLVSNVAAAEFERQSARGTRNLEAYDQFLRGWYEMQILTSETIARAIPMFERAIELDPDYARAYAARAIARASNVRFRFASGSEDTYEAALKLAERAVSLDPNDVVVLRGLGSVLRLSGDYDGAIAAYEKALVWSPSDPDVLITLALTLAFSGHGEEALEKAGLATRLNPIPEPAFYAFRGTARYVNGDYEAAAMDFEKFRELNPGLIVSYYNLAASYAQVGREDDARAATEALLTRAPKFTIQGLLKEIPMKGIARERYIEGLRKAGLPETPPPA